MQVLDRRTRDRLGVAWVLDGLVVTCAHVVAASSGRLGDVLVAEVGHEGARFSSVRREAPRACAVVGVRQAEDLAVLAIGPQVPLAKLATRVPTLGEEVTVRLPDREVRSTVVGRREPASLRCHGMTAPLSTAVYLVAGQWEVGHSGSPVFSAVGTFVGMLVARSATPVAGVVVAAPAITGSVQTILWNAAVGRWGANPRER